MRKANGQFEKRCIRFWQPDNWDEGRLSNRGRFLVYRPDYPYAYGDGYALRYHIVWWLRTGEVVPKGFDLHHLNEIKTDDAFDNLELLPHEEHSRHHNPQDRPLATCANCGDSYERPRWRVAERQKSGFKPRFCSQACYHTYPKSVETKQRQSAGLRLAYAKGKR